MIGEIDDLFGRPIFFLHFPLAFAFGVRERAGIHPGLFAW